MLEHNMNSKKTKKKQLRHSEEKDSIRDTKLE